MHPLPEPSHPLAIRLRDDLSHRWHQGERVRVESYLDQHPQLRDNTEILLDLIKGEILLRREDSESPSLDEYILRFPTLESRLREVWSLFEMLQGADPTPPTAIESTGPDHPILPPVAPSFVLPGYDLGAELGRGGMGVVLRARQLELDRTVAVKLIRTGPLAGSEEMARFRTEAIAVARLRHPGVVQVHTFGEHEGCLYLVMEYLPGGSLAAKLRKGLLPLEEAIRLVQQIAVALHQAHEAHVIHRDLKPGNVLLEADGTPRISDFGLARLLDADSSQTVSGVVLGTPSYMAPEQARGEVRDVGPAADIWALGVILYECLTGKTPFRGKSRTETLRLVQTATPPPLRTLRPEVPAALEAICRKCLEKRPEDRYPTAGAVAEELARWLGGEPVQTRNRPLQRLLRPLRRRPQLALAIIAAPFLLATAFTGFILWPEQLSRPMERRLARHEPAVLIEQGKLPLWYEWLGDSKVGPPRLGKEGQTLVQTQGIALLALLRDPQLDRYRMRVEMRHDRGNEFSRVGLFVGYQTIRTRSGKAGFFAQGTFTDHLDAGAEYDLVEMATRGTPRNLPPRPINSIYLGGRVYGGDGFEDQPDLRAAERQREAFQAKQLEPHLWRTLICEVTPTEIRLFWEDLSGKSLTLLTDTLQDSVREASLDDYWKPRLGELRPTFRPRGRLGLLVERSLVSVRRVVVEPL